MKTHPREILIYYNASSPSDRKTIAHAQSTGQKIRTLEHSKSRSTTTNWKSLLKSLDKHPKELMNKADPYYQANIKGKEFNMHGWLNILQNNPGLIKHPIALKGSQAIICQTPTDIYKLA
jgi:arsenate reductase